jgi:hypothetical protein
MTPLLRHPALVLAALGAVSGYLGTFFLGVGYGTAPDPGIYMAPTGLWFALVIGFGVWRWADAHVTSALSAAVATWIGWEIAVNLAMKLDGPWLQALPGDHLWKAYASGFAAGAVGAFMTWAGAAAHAPAMRRSSVAAGVVATGALFGLLLQATNNFDTGLVLLVPWQMAVAAMIGRNLKAASERVSPGTKARPDPETATGHGADQIRPRTAGRTGLKLLIPASLIEAVANGGKRCSRSLARAGLLPALSSH